MGNPISTAEIAAIRTEAALALDKTCVIQRKVRTPVASGGASTLPVPIATVMAGMSQPTASQLANYGYLIGSLSAWQLKMAVGTDVKEKDVLVIEGRTLYVQKVLTPRSYAVLLTLLVTEV